MHDDDELLAALGGALNEPTLEPEPARIEAIRAAATARRDARPVAPPERSAAADPVRIDGVRRRRAPTRLRRRSLALAAGVIAIAIGAAIVASTRDVDRGEVEYAGPISGNGSVGELTVTKTGIGRVVELDTDDLPILPTGELYEVWFVGSGDAPGSPNRISAGTFHPDDEGRSHVTFAAAVDPAEYPLVQITSEPGDGDPAPSDLVVLEATIG